MPGDLPYGLPGVYSAELLYQTAPQLDKNALLARLQQHCGQVASLDPTDPLLAFAFLDHPVQYKDGAVPAQVLITQVEKQPDIATLTPALEQTWDWGEARQAVSSCNASVLVNDFMARGLDHRARLALFHGVIVSLLELTSCQAIHWRPSQRMVDPAYYLRVRQEQEDTIYPAINVRMYNVSDRGRGEKLMDTMGLAAFGLPDLQCHFVNLAPPQVAQLLGNIAYYLFSEGDVINDGETVPGVTGQEKWRCHHEEALAPPERDVLDINPGPPFAAGKRNH
jgi:hypothetical protein